MKPFLLFGWLLLPVAGFAQQSPAPASTPAAAAKLPIVLPPKKANVILVQRRDSGLVALTALMQGLVNRGYAIKDVDRERLTVRTEPRAVSEVGAVILTGAVQGRQFVLTGAFAPELASRRSTPIMYTGEVRHDHASEAWEEMVKAAGMLGGSLTYRTQ